MVDGLRKERKIFVRKPELNEKNANLLLIQKGALPVDFNGVELIKTYESLGSEIASVINEPNDMESLESKIRSAFGGEALTAKELLEKLNLNWTTQKLNSFLKRLTFIEVLKEKNRNLYLVKGTTKTRQTTLFV